MRNLRLKHKNKNPKSTGHQTHHKDGDSQSITLNNHDDTLRPTCEPIPEHCEHEHTDPRFQEPLSRGFLDTAPGVAQKAVRVRKVARSQQGDIYGSTESLPEVHVCIVYHLRCADIIVDIHVCEGGMGKGTCGI